VFGVFCFLLSVVSCCLCCFCCFWGFVCCFCAFSGISSDSVPPDNPKFEGNGPPPNKSRLRTGLKQVKVHRSLIRIKTDWTIFRGDSKYGTPVAIREMLHDSMIANLTTTAMGTATTPTPKPSASASARTSTKTGTITFVGGLMYVHYPSSRDLPKQQTCIFYRM
jgi:hypothetical protein